MTEKEILAALAKIGEGIQAKRKANFSSADAFAYEIHLSRSNMWRAESGNDLRLSTLLKILAGLNVTAADFFKDLGI